MHVNLKINKLLKKDGSKEALAKHQKRTLKFILKEVSPKRKAVKSEIDSEKHEERKLKLEVEEKRLMAFEKLILSLLLVLCLSHDDTDQITELLS